MRLQDSYEEGGCYHAVDGALRTPLSYDQRARKRAWREARTRRVQ